MASAPFLLALGARVRALRHARRLSRAELAERSGLSERFVAELELGRGNIAVTRLAAVAAALGVRPGQLLDGEPAPAAPAPGVIALLGLRGAGKSTIGPRLASRLGLPFFELDGLVEAEAGLSLSELFALHGEAYYRRLERMVLERFLDCTSSAVLAVAGGAVSSPETMALLEARTRTVWLKARPEDHLRRVRSQGDQRPMRGRPRAMDDLRRLLAEREPLYRRAQVVVDTSALGVRGSVDALTRALAAQGRPETFRTNARPQSPRRDPP